MSVVFMLFVFVATGLCWKSHRLEICDDENSVDITAGTHLSGGVIYHDGVRYDQSEYYTDKRTGSDRGCVCSKGTCIRKCCPLGYGYNYKSKQCVKVYERFAPPVWDNYAYEMLKVNASDIFHFVPGKMNCTDSKTRIRIGQATKNFVLRVDGKLYIQIPESIPPWLVQTPDEYCIDTFVREDPTTGERTSSLDALICFADKVNNEQYVLRFTCMLISCLFILATVAVYAWLPELRNLHGRVLMAYLLSLFVGFTFLATMQILLTINNITVTTCVYFTFVIYYSLLAAFFWLNVMCFDIWWTFSGKRGKSLEKMSLRTRFVAYSLYAFGIPTVLTALLVGLEFSGLPPHPLLPMIRQQGCFIYGTSKLIYLYGPISILCIANMTFFVLTAVKIAQIKKQTSVLKSKDSSTHDQHRNDRQRLLLYIKLLAVMGVSWILEVVSAIYPEAEDIWKFTDAYNVLIGLIIFIIFVCKRKIFRLIKKRYKQLRGDPMSRTQTTTSRTLSTREDVAMTSIKSK
ncbi:G-protein coupled receptor Mth2 isoform X5 [Bombyx mori]|uniref:G-protein coupled receptors family 2 profile 2 domain-containing protein n=1 Tax=Bombyx mori TaxID=7091 RepID=A0A8R2QT35_BOMMO|nr:G-protein coupled receptor Mth2 isoform X2 [Bombyx mori]